MFAFETKMQITNLWFFYLVFMCVNPFTDTEILEVNNILSTIETIFEKSSKLEFCEMHLIGASHFDCRFKQ